MQADPIPLYHNLHQTTNSQRLR